MTKRLILVGILAAVCCGAGSTLAAPQEAREPDAKETHSERWYVRNGLDTGAKAVAKKRPVATTVAALTKLPAPKTVPQGERVAPVEATQYMATARLVRYVRHRDGDFQFVLRDERTGATIICELPDPDEVTASPFSKQITAARKAFQSRFAPFDVVQTPAPVRVRVSGVGYFGKVGGSDGTDSAGARNGLQLHPVTGFAVLPTR